MKRIIKDLNDFRESDYFSYETECKLLWKKKNISLIIDFGEEANKSEALKKYKDKINEILNWIDANKQTVSDFLISHQCITLAEEWISANKKVGENSYKNDFGEIVNIPITDEDFYNAMYLDSVLIDFEEDESKPDTTMHILFKPDYFKKHSLIVYVDGDKNIEYGDIAG